MVGAGGRFGRRPAAGLPEADDPDAEEHGGDRGDDARQHQGVTVRGGLPAGRALEHQHADGQRCGAEERGQPGGGHAGDRPVDRRQPLTGVGGQVVPAPGGPVLARRGEQRAPRGQQGTLGGRDAGIERRPPQDGIAPRRLMLVTHRPAPVPRSCHRD